MPDSLGSGRRQEYELVHPGEDIEHGYPENPILADLIMRQIASQLHSGIYVEDKVLYWAWDCCVRRYIPPIVERYMCLRRRGIPNGGMTADGKKLRKSETVIKEQIIERDLDNASSLAESKPGIITETKKKLAVRLGMTQSSVQRRWTEIRSERKRGPGRPSSKPGR